MQDAEWLVVCLCADWCGTCRDYRPAFEAIAAQFPGTAVRWIDIEDEADEVGDYDVVDFPTILIQRAGDVLFYGPLRPDISHLRRLYEALRDQSPEESRARKLGTVPGF
jgi:thiol-disulfide isomerase/thioredoxin